MPRSTLVNFFGSPFRAACITIALVAMLLAGPAGQAAAAGRMEIPDRLILQVRPGASEADVQREIALHGGRIVGRADQIGLLVAELPKGKGRAARAILARSKRFKFVEPDALLEPTFVPNDTHVPDAWHLGVIDLFGAWNITSGSPDTPIAILDSGVDPDHPDLAGRLVPGWNFYDNNADTSDVQGHGTLVAGAAAAAGNNGIGVVGPAYVNPIMPVRVTNSDGWGLQSAIVSGLIWAADNGARVANLSFGGVHSSSAVTSAAQYFTNKGGLVTVSAGNFGNDDGSPDNLYMVSVSATASTDVITSWSSFGSYIDVAAPGSSVWSTVIGGTYAPVSGTSFSAPVTAGVIGLIFAAKPSLTPQEAEAILEETADDLGAQGFDVMYGWGRINAGSAVMVAQGGGAPAPDTTAPIAAITEPAESATLSGEVTIAASAVDDTAVTEVRFYVDGQLLAVDVTSPYSALWVTAGHADGPHTLFAEAYDSAQNRGASQTVIVNVSNIAPDTTAPTVQIINPTEGAALAGVVTVSALASDDDAVAEIRIYVNGQLAWMGETSPLSVTVDTAQSPDGTYTLQAEASDLSGNVGVSAPVTVSVANAPHAPDPAPDPTPDPTPDPAPERAGPNVVFVNQPDSGAVHPKKQTFTVEASGPSPILYVEFFIDGVARRKKDKSAPYTLQASTSKWSVGAHVIMARARDLAGRTGEASITVTRPLSEKEKRNLEKKLQKELQKKNKKKKSKNK